MSISRERQLIEIFKGQQSLLGIFKTNLLNLRNIAKEREITIGNIQEKIYYQELTIENLQDTEAKSMTFKGNASDLTREFSGYQFNAYQYSSEYPYASGSIEALLDRFSNDDYLAIDYRYSIVWFRLIDPVIFGYRSYRKIWIRRSFRIDTMFCVAHPYNCIEIS